VSQTHLDRDNVPSAVPIDATSAVPIDVLDEPKPFWKVPPLHKAQVKSLAVMWAVLTGAYLLVGLAVVHLWEPSRAGRADARVSEWFNDQRTGQRNELAEIGSAFSNTETKIGLLIVLCPLMLWMYRRWHDWAFLAIGLLFEVAVFFTASKIVRRDRPQVEQLDTAPTFSWPSGHIAAAVVFYVGLATVVFWNTRSRSARAVFTTIAVVVPLIVITSRLYLGMHYVTDAVGGVVLGIVTLLIVRHQLIAARGGRPMSDPRP
jgi:membrane-associated phospholipid phosphatase